ncbi:MAG: CDP-alcohol phosphatidyltransferase family protein [Actinomycetota bacterium]
MQETSSAEAIPARKRVADMLTASRLVIALAVITVGLLFGREAAGIVLMLILIGWTTDVADGQLARSLETPVQSRIGDNDLAVDLVLDLAGYIYFIACGFLAPVWSLGYLLAACIIVSFVRTRRIILILEMPLLIITPIIAFTQLNWVSIIYVAWLLGILVYNWSRMISIIGFMWGRD